MIKMLLRNRAKIINQRNYFTVIGGGNLGQAIVNGLNKTELPNQNDIYLTRRDLSKLKSFISNKVILTSDNNFAIQKSKYITVCVEPKHAESFFKSINFCNDESNKDKYLISCISGITLNQIRNWANFELFEGRVHITRAMPNTAVAVNSGLICFSGDPLDDEGYKIFHSLGKIHKIDEDQMQSATILGACGIAFAMKYVRAATQGGVEIGFSSNTSQKMVEQTVHGAIRLLQDNCSHPEQEIDRVTTPNGCTITGLNELEHYHFSSAVVRGITKALDKIK